MNYLHNNIDTPFNSSQYGGLLEDEYPWNRTVLSTQDMITQNRYGVASNVGLDELSSYMSNQDR